MSLYQGTLAQCPFPHSDCSCPSGVLAIPSPSLSLALPLEIGLPSGSSLALPLAGWLTARPNQEEWEASDFEDEEGRWVQASPDYGELEGPNPQGWGG